MYDSDRLLVGAKRNSYTVYDAMFVFGLAYIAAQVFGSMGLIAFYSEIVSSVMIQAAFFLTVCAYSSGRGINMRQAAKYNKCNPVFILLAIAAVPFALALVLPLTDLWLGFLSLLGLNPDTAGSSESYSVFGWVIYTITVSVGPMLGEEALMRGVVANGLADRKSKLSAIFISAVLFTALHGNAVQFVNPFVSGAIMALLMFKSGSILPGMIMHFTNNLLVTVIGLTCDAQVSGFISDNALWVALVGAIGLAAIVFAVIKLGRTVKLTEKPVKEDCSLPVPEETPPALRFAYAECFAINRRHERRSRIVFVLALASCAISFALSLFI